MKTFVYLILSILVFIFAIGLTIHRNFSLNYFYDKPQDKDWVCWYTSVKRKECGTYGYSKSKKKAKQVAKDLCIKECNSRCFLEYCRIYRGR